jgi:hypothetical protein
MVAALVAGLVASGSPVKIPDDCRLASTMVGCVAYVAGDEASSGVPCVAGAVPVIDEYLVESPPRSTPLDGAKYASSCSSSSSSSYLAGWA